MTAHDLLLRTARQIVAERARDDAARLRQLRAMRLAVDPGSRSVAVALLCSRQIAALERRAGCA